MFLIVGGGTATKKDNSGQSKNRENTKGENTIQLERKSPLI